MRFLQKPEKYLILENHDSCVGGTLMNNSGTYSNLSKNQFNKTGTYNSFAANGKTEPEVNKVGNNVQDNDAYLKQSVETATPAKLVEMLYSGAIKFLEVAEVKIESKEFDVVNEKIKRVEDIIMELNISLDMEKGGAISTNLRNLYNYMYQRLLDSNAKKDIKGITEVKNLLVDLRETWAEAMKKEGSLANKLPDPKRARLNVSL